MEHRELGDGRRVGEAPGKHHDDGEDQGRGADHRSPDQDWFGRGFERVSRPIVLLQQQLGTREIHIDAKFVFELSLNAWNLFDEAELINALRIVGDRSVGIDGDGDGPHAEKSEGHEAEGKYSNGDLGAGIEEGGDAGGSAEIGKRIGRSHEAANDDSAHPVGGEISGGEPAENIKGCTALATGGDDLADMAALDAGKDLREFRDQRRRLCRRR